MSNAIDMQLIADFGGTMLWPMIALSNIAQGSAVLGMIYLQRKNADAQEVNVPSCISLLPRRYRARYVRRQPEIPLPVYLRHDWLCHRGSCLRGYFYHGQRHRSASPAFCPSSLPCMVIAIVVPFVLTVSVGKRKALPDFVRRVP